MAGLSLALYYPVQWLYTLENRKVMWPLFLLATIALGVVVGLIWARIDRGPVIRTSVITGVLIAFVMLVDKMLRTWSLYASTDSINFRPVPTYGQINDQINAELLWRYADGEIAKADIFWANFLDLGIHLILPTIALTLISFAGYVRFSRGTLLEVLNQDYIRTARAKGLPERTVIMRHAFRNTLIPLTTIIVVDFAGIIGGAIITEKVFGWEGMGTKFNVAITSFDLNLLMGVFFITASMAVIANLVADLLYSALDPRIRVGAK